MYEMRVHVATVECRFLNFKASDFPLENEHVAVIRGVSENNP